MEDQKIVPQKDNDYVTPLHVLYDDSRYWFDYRLKNSFKPKIVVKKKLTKTDKDIK